MTILAALGASSTGQRARPEAIAQRLGSGAKLRLLHVGNEGPAIRNLETPSRMGNYERALRKAGKRVLARALAPVTTAGLADEFALKPIIAGQQHPANRIVAEDAPRNAEQPVLPVQDMQGSHASEPASEQAGKVRDEFSTLMIVSSTAVTPRLTAMLKILLIPVLAAVIAAVPATAVRAAAREAHPAGDIPDSQAFVPFSSPLGFSIKVPEGWARREGPSMVRFEDKFLSLQVTVAQRAAAPTVGEIKNNELAALERSARAVRIVKVEPVKLPAGPVIEARYTADSAPNPVTNKSVRLDCVGHYAWKAGQMATVTFCAPAGADNADQWALMARSFKWK